MAVKFFHGVACKRCGSTLRFERGGRCVACVRTRDRGRYAKRRPRQKAYYEEHSDRIRAYSRKHTQQKHAKDPRHKMLSSAKERAKLRGREFTIAIDDIVIPEVCPLLGVKITIGSRAVKDSSPTIDRKNSALGYTPDNIWVISWRANRIKCDATKDEIARMLANWPC